jgi:hypothetical protein
MWNAIIIACASSPPASVSMINLVNFGRYNASFVFKTDGMAGTPRD